VTGESFFGSEFKNPFVAEPSGGTNDTAAKAASRSVAAGPDINRQASRTVAMGEGRSGVGPNSAPAERAVAASFFRGLAEAGPAIHVAPLAPGSVTGGFTGTVAAKLGSSIFAKVRADANYRAAKEAQGAAAEKTQAEIDWLKKRAQGTTVKWPGVTGMEGPLGKEGEFDSEVLNNLVRVATAKLSAGKKDPANQALNYSAADSGERSLREEIERELNASKVQYNDKVASQLVKAAKSLNPSIKSKAFSQLGLNEKSFNNDYPTQIDRDVALATAAQGLVDKYGFRHKARLESDRAPQFRRYRQIKDEVAGYGANGSAPQYDQMMKSFESAIVKAIQED
jgi:hypothetical protein